RGARLAAAAAGARPRDRLPRVPASAGLSVVPGGDLLARFRLLRRAAHRADAARPRERPARVVGRAPSGGARRGHHRASARCAPRLARVLGAGAARAGPPLVLPALRGPIAAAYPRDALLPRAQP